MRSLPILIVALMIAVLVPHVCAENVIYPQEYYNLKSDVDSWMNGKALYDGGFSDVEFQFAQLRESRRQTILMEKQNELITEQNELLINLTITEYCMPTDGNTIPPIKWHCEKALGSGML